jgi:hypothetical protein
VSAAVLVKAPAAHLGLVLAFAAFQKMGLRCVGTRLVWIGATITILPAALWYVHAHRYWIEFGNSLGISNEFHWLGLDILGDPHRWLNLIRLECTQVLGPFGALLAVIGIRRDSRSAGLIAAWLASAWLLDAAALRTTSEPWAFYYHVTSAAPAALLMGLGVAELQRFAPDGRMKRNLASFGFLLMVAGNLAFLGLFAVQRGRERFGDGSLAEARACAESYRAAIPPRGRIVFPGGEGIDESGRRIAYDASWMFYFTDRKGFTFPREEWSLETLESIRQRGGRYYFLSRNPAPKDEALTRAILARYPRLQECGEYWVLDLGEDSSSGSAETHRRIRAPSRAR